MKRFVCTSESDTRALGERLIRVLPVPAFVALTGDLGAGKTALIRGMGEALGIDDVSSPTFTIVHEYNTVPKLMHFDAYRLGDADELYAIGFSDYLAQDAVIVMEWAELVESALPEERLDILVEGSGDEARTVTLAANGDIYERAVERL